MMDKYSPKKALRRLILGAVSKVDLPLHINNLFQRDKITILTYHGVIDRPLPVADWSFIGASMFRDQMRYIKDNYKVVSLSRAVEMIKTDSLRGKNVVVTFDDGFHNNYSVAFPVLRELSIPATCFLSTKFVDTTDTPWFCRVHRAISQTAEPAFAWRGEEYTLDRGESKSRVSSQIQKEMKKIPAPEMAREIGILEELLGVERSREEVGSPYRMLESAAIREMARSDLVEFGSHTYSHAILSKLEPARQKEEIERSLKDVESFTGRRCRHFAYPNGSASDYDSSTLELLESLDVDSASTLIRGVNTRDTSPLGLKRYCVGGSEGMGNFRLLVNNVIG